MFTDRGRRGENLVIEISPTPDTTFTAKIAYSEKGSLSNIEKMTPACMMTCIDGIMSIIGPPKEVKQGFWIGVTQNARALYELGLSTLSAQEPLTYNYTPGYMVDPVIAARLDRI
jgi:hypothetical protein